MFGHAQMTSVQSTDVRPEPVYADIGCTPSLSANNANVSLPLDDDHVEYVAVKQLSEDCRNDNDSGVQTGRFHNILDYIIIFTTFVT